MRKRLFIAINLPEEVKDKIESTIEKIRFEFTGDIRFVERENWHITVAFLGWQEDGAIGPILDGVKKTTEEFEAQEIEITDIDYGPKNKPPRMIWLNGSIKTSKKLAEIKNILEDKLIDGGVVFGREHHILSVHITLARLQTPDDLPAIKTDLNLKFTAMGLDLMESGLHRSGAEYDILQRFPFHN